MDQKSLNVSSIEDAKNKVSDIEVIGNGDTFELLCKASSKKQGWMKSAKAMMVPGIGSVVQVTTQQGDNVAEALVFVPRAFIMPDINGGKKLVEFGQYIPAGFEELQTQDSCVGRECYVRAGLQWQPYTYAAVQFNHRVVARCVPPADKEGETVERNIPPGS